MTAIGYIFRHFIIGRTDAKKTQTKRVLELTRKAGIILSKDLKTQQPST